MTRSRLNLADIMHQLFAGSRHSITNHHTHTMGLRYYYTYGLPSFLIIIVALYLLFTGQFFRLPCSITTLTPPIPNRFRRSLQRRPLPRRDKSLLVGCDWHRTVHRVERARCRMVTSFHVKTIRCAITEACFFFAFFFLRSL